MSQSGYYIIDTHTHILPGMDDGPNQAMEGVEMVKELQEQGVSLIVSSSHFYLHKESIDSFLARRQVAYDSLLKEWERVEGDKPLPVILGAEIRLERNLTYEDKLDLLKIENTNLLMIELPYSKLEGWEHRIIENIVYKYKIRPVLAHVDRYIDIFDSQSYDDLQRIPDVVFQFNASLVDEKRARRLLLNTIEARMPVLLGTDAHGIDKRKPEYFKIVDYLKRKLGEDDFNKLMIDTNMLLNLN